MTSTAAAQRSDPLTTAAEFLRDIKFSHSVFALPFAVLATFVSAGGAPAWTQVGLIVLCMVGARTFAMALNRLLDARLDRLNPRTAGRAIPAGRLSRYFVLGMSVLSAAAFLAGCVGFWALHNNMWPTVLGPLVLIFLAAYPLLKRFTSLCHYYLGAALALAPVCADLAISGHVHLWAVVLAAGVLLWTAGFDIIYACQDVRSDREQGVHAVPARFGTTAALWIARGTHVLCAAAYFATGLLAPGLGTLYLVAAGAACVLLLTQHMLVRATDLSRVNLAFFTLNGVISVMLGIVGVIDVLIG